MGAFIFFQNLRQIKKNLIMEKSSATFFGSSSHTSKSSKTETHEESSGKKCDRGQQSGNRDDKECKGSVCWPVIIFIVIIIIILICLFCSSGLDNSTKTSCAAGLIVFLIIWALVIWFFCVYQNQTAAWFFLLVPVALAIFWWIARFLSQATHCGCETHSNVC